MMKSLFDQFKDSNMVLSLGHKEGAKDLALASDTAGHMGTDLPRPRSAQTGGNC